MILNLGSGRYPLDHAVNLDITNGWDACDGLPVFVDDTIEAVTISHMLMYLTVAQIVTLFEEIRRVLVPEGVLRITEDDSRIPSNIWHDAVSTQTPEGFARALRAVGFSDVREVGHLVSRHSADLIQDFHGAPPLVFHMEATA